MTFISTLIAALALAVNLTITPNVGPAPLKSNFVATVTGPISGAVCLELSYDGEVQGTAFCKPIEIEDDSTQTVEWNLNGTQAGSYSFRAVLAVDGEAVEYSAPVAITIQ